jgi:hypothetical protein
MIVPIVAPDLVPGRVDGQVGVADDRLARRRRTSRRPRRTRPWPSRALRCPDAPQDRLDPEDELGRRERLRQVVVGAILEPGDAIDRGSPGGEHQDRRRCRFLVPTDRPDDGPAVELGQHQIEDHQRGLVRLDRLEGGRAVGSGHDREAVAFEVRPDQADDLGVVVDDEDRTVRPRVLTG